MTVKPGDTVSAVTLAGEGNDPKRVVGIYSEHTVSGNPILGVEPFTAYVVTDDVDNWSVVKESVKPYHPRRG